MICNRDCFNCPYSDCILPDKAHLSPYNPERKKNYYRENRTAKIAYQTAYNAKHKKERQEWSKNHWATMTEEQREIERAKARERYKKRNEKLNGVSKGL